MLIINYYVYYKLCISVNISSIVEKYMLIIWFSISDVISISLSQGIVGYFVSEVWAILLKSYLTSNVRHSKTDKDFDML